MLLENATDQDGDELFASSLETNDPNASIGQIMAMALTR
ncbi:hypothetical protein OH492_17735 [Vibrio chagasii]|nr:hypothetical protein [Vibrio chagasii]